MEPLEKKEIGGKRLKILQHLKIKEDHKWQFSIDTERCMILEFAIHKPAMKVREHIFFSLQCVLAADVHV